MSTADSMPVYGHIETEALIMNAMDFVSTSKLFWAKKKHIEIVQDFGQLGIGTSESGFALLDSDGNLFVCQVLKSKFANLGGINAMLKSVIEGVPDALGQET
jgi:hypothetical protein